MKKILQMKNAITLVALVITVIILLIVGGVAISAIVGGNSIFGRTISAATQYKKESLIETITNVKMQLFMDGIEVNVRNLVNKLIELGIINETDYIIELEDETATLIDRKEGIVIDIVKDIYGEIIINGFIVDDISKVVKPVINYSLEPESGENLKEVKITLTITEAINGITKLTFPDGTEKTYSKEKSITEEYIVNNNDTYEFVVESAIGRKITKYIVIDYMEKANNILIVPSTLEPINTDIKVNFTFDSRALEAGYICQYKVGEANWKNATLNQEITVTENTEIYARYFNGSEEYKPASLSISNIDKVLPKISNLTTNNVKLETFYDTVTIEAVDEESGIAGYAITSTTEEPTTWSVMNNIDLTNVQVKQQYGATWARVFWHNNNFGTQFFASDAEVLSTDSTYKYSILNRLEEFRNSEGKFEFLLQYPYNYPTQYNRWIQTENPATTNEKVSGYEAVHIDWNQMYWGGLAKSSANASTYIDGSVGHTNWYYSIGSKVVWQGGVPMNVENPATTSIVELWVRIDNLQDETKDKVSITMNVPEGDGEYYIWVKDKANNVVNEKFVINSPYRGIQTKEEKDAIWAKVFHHNNGAGTILFSSDAEVLSTNAVYKYSILNRLEEFRNSEGQFEFLLQYPNDTTQYNRWLQTDNPTTATIADTTSGKTVGGYEAVHIDWTINYWGGLAKSSANASTYIDGSVGHTYWFYAIGAKKIHSTGIPSYNVTNYVTELYVRID